MTADPRVRWSEELAVRLDATPDEVVATFLRALPGTDFVPPAVQAAALNALGSTGLPTGRDPIVEIILRDEVEAFARTYWMLEPDQRLTTWAELSRRGASDSRLRELEPALDIPATSLIDPFAEELAVLLRSLFVLRPRERAIRRNAWLAACAAEEARWREAFATVQREAPALAALDSQLSATLSQSLAALGSAASAAVASTITSRASVAVDVADFSARMARYYRTSANESRSDQPVSAGKAIMFGFIVLFGIFGVVSRSSRHVEPPINSPPTLPVAGEFTVVEVEQFKRFERALDMGISAQTPTRYNEWRDANRPQGGVGARPVGTPQYGSPRMAYFSDKQIQELILYDAEQQGVRPAGYEQWQQAGKPFQPGSYLLPATVGR